MSWRKRENDLQQRLLGLIARFEICINTSFVFVSVSRERCVAPAREFTLTMIFNFSFNFFHSKFSMSRVIVGQYRSTLTSILRLPSALSSLSNKHENYHNASRQKNERVEIQSSNNNNENEEEKKMKWKLKKVFILTLKIIPAHRIRSSRSANELYIALGTGAVIKLKWLNGDKWLVIFSSVSRRVRRDPSGRMRLNFSFSFLASAIDVLLLRMEYNMLIM